MSTLQLPLASVRAAFDTLVSLLAQDIREGEDPPPMPETIDVEIDVAMAAALAKAGWAPIIRTERRTVTVNVAGNERVLMEMSEADLQRWLLTEADGLRLMADAEDENSLFALAQAVSVPLTAMALGITTEQAWTIAPTARREIVAAQASLNEAHLYRAMAEARKEAADGQ